MSKVSIVDNEKGVSEVIGELLILAMVISATAGISSMIRPPSMDESHYKLLVRDSKQPINSTQAFDIVMIAGNIKYTDLKVIVRNATDNSLIDTATYNNSWVEGGIIRANASDIDSYFSTGDILTFTGPLDAGLYEIIVASSNRIAIDSFVELR